MPADHSLRQVRAEIAGRTHAILCHPDHRWREAGGTWRSEGPMRDESKHALNGYWRGSGEFRRGGTTWRWHAPCWILRCPGEHGAARFDPGPVHESWIVVPGATAELLIAGGQLDPRRRVIATEPDAAEAQVWRRALRQLSDRLSGSVGAAPWGPALAALQELCAAIWCGGPQADPVDPDLARIRAAVRADPGRRWRAADLAALCGCRSDTLRQRCHRRHGHGPSAVVRSVRMELAADWLREGLVKQVARALGYRDHRHFARDFRRHHGLLPSDYRRLIGNG